MKRVTVGSTVATLFTTCLVIVFLTAKKCTICFSPEVMAIKFFVSGLIIFIGSIYFTRLYLKSEKIIFNIETLPLLETNEAVSDVPFSCEGTVTIDQKNVLVSPYTNTSCVYYHSITEEHRGSGKHSRWVIVENRTNFVPFYVQDKRGKLKVDLTNVDTDLSAYKLENKNKTIPDPDCSEIDCRPVMIHEEFTKGSKELFGFISTPGTKFRRTEYILMPNTKVFVHGYVSTVQNELVLHETENHPLLISEKTKDTYVNEFYKGGNLIFFVHFLLAIGYTISLLSIDYFLHVPVSLLYLSLILGNVGITGSVLFTMYNRIITLKVRAEAAVSNIDVELKRRAEVIPNIVTLVKEYTGYEKNIFEQIPALRVQMTPEQSMGSKALPAYSALLGVIEKYPNLKATKSYQQLFHALVDAEERIAYSRTFYNRNVRKLNTLITQFPFVLISYLYQIKPMEYLSVIEEAK